MKFWAGLISRAVVGAVGLTTCISLAHGQDKDALIQQVLGGKTGNPLGGDQPADTQKDIVLQPAMIQRGPLAQSRLEQLMSQRAGSQLELFGYDQLGVSRAVTQPQAGAVQDGYILGPGDSVVVTLRGQENSEFRPSVDRNGQVSLPRLSPISAAGRTLGDFRREVVDAVRRSYVATDAFVSVSRIRQAVVWVTGEVNSPGQRIVTGLSSPLDAILLSGGVKKSGSLRSVRLVRGSRQYNIDLYSFLTPSGAASTIRLTDGDRIIVPPLGRTVAVIGPVRRPAIYELAAGTSSISSRALISLAGGIEVRGAYNLSVLRIRPDGRSEMIELGSKGGGVSDSEVLFVHPDADETVSRATLSGGTSFAGQYSLGNKATLSSLLKAPGALGQTPYTLFGLISRKDPRTFMRVLIPFTPVGVVSGTEEVALQSDDVVRVLSVSEMRMLRRILEAYIGKQMQTDHLQRDPLAPPPANGINVDPGTTPSMPDDNGNVKPIVNPYAPPPDQGDLVTNYLLAQRARAGSTPTMRDQIDALSALEMGDTPGVVYGSLLPYPTYIQAPSAAGATTSEMVQQQQQQALMLQQQQSQVASLNPYASASGITPNLPSNYPSDSPNSGQQGFNPQLGGHGYSAQQFRSGQPQAGDNARTFGFLSRQLGVEPLALVNFLADNVATISGAVRAPGTYFVGPRVELRDLVAAAGGTNQWVDPNGVEIVSTSIDPQSGQAITRREVHSLANGTPAVFVQRMANVRFNQVYSDAGAGSITIQGQVRFAGNYQFTRGERLSELLTRAGGLTNVAYPMGAVFLRKSAAGIERTGYLRAARDLEAQVLVGMTKVGQDKLSPEAVRAVQSFVARLRTQQAVGRITVVADPAVLAAKPELDPLLEPGDVIYIPQRPSTVTVMGEVMQPGSYQFRSDANVREYVSQAGGYGQFSDSSLTFVVLPDGTARKADGSWLNFSSAAIPPGSTIVVPRDVAPIDLRQVLLDATSIFSQLAISAASLSVISSN